MCDMKPTPHDWDGLMAALGRVRILRALRYRERRHIFGRSHCHDRLYHLVYHVSGKIRIRVGENEYAVGDDTLLLILPGQIHSSLPGPGSVFDMIEIRFCLEGDASLPLPLLPNVFALRQPARILPAFERTVNAFLLNPEPDDWLTRLRLAEILVLMAQEAAETRDAAGAGSDIAWRVRSVTHHIAGHFAEPLTVEDLADLVGLSPSYLAASFRRITSVSPIEYAIRVRLHHAKDLLRSSTMSVDEIARATGFSTARYLARTFRKRLEISPGAYRNSDRQLT